MAPVGWTVTTVGNLETGALTWPPAYLPSSEEAPFSSSSSGGRGLKGLSQQPGPPGPSPAMALGPGPLDFSRLAAQPLHHAPPADLSDGRDTGSAQTWETPGVYALSAFFSSPPCSPRGPEATQCGSKLQTEDQ